MILQGKVILCTVCAINKGRKVRMGIVAVGKCDGSWGVRKGEEVIGEVRKCRWATSRKVFPVVDMGVYR